MAKKFYRSRADRKIAGVCGGLGEYFDVDPTLIRALFVASILAGGAGLILYVVLWVMLGESPSGKPKTP